ncbi:MAG TPA: thiamine ABC transporter substrate-binding protein [Petrotogaceae bacterium]|nr:thiamine ABC transporter substrate-binding protein [Petrotogaceae bacterium]HQO12404.1 thiamine ABC transporter substrate-binding protein [Petrotogaceae bacterium]
MKKWLVLAVLLIGIAAFSVSQLNVYVYESLNWIEDKLIGTFESSNNCKVNVVRLGDAGNMVARLKLEKKNPKADVVIGLDQSLSMSAISEGLLQPYISPMLSKLRDPNLIFDKDYYVTPFDYGAIAFVYDPSKLSKIPEKMEDISAYKNSLIIQDPKSSSTGQALLIWTIALYNDSWTDFWKKMKPAVLTVTPSWDDAFSKFEQGEAPIMLSYATDGAYSYHYYQSTKYKAFIPKDGAYVQIEGAGIVKGSKNKQLAQKFIDFLLSDEFQQEVALNQWMFPVTDVKLPEAFKYAVVPEKILSVDIKAISSQMDKYIKTWEEIMYK